MANKMTKVEMFTAIKAMVADNQDMVDFLDHEIELVNKRNSRKSNTPSKKDKENASIMDTIAKVLTNAEAPMTVSEIVTALDGGYTNQKISALLKKMVDNGKVAKAYEKKVARFSIA